MKYICVFVFAALSGNYFAQQIDLTSNLVICMPMNGNANDYSGNNNNGLVSGATPTVNRFGTANSAYHFDGINDFISVQPSPSINNIEGNSELTISGWCRVDDWYQGYNVFAVLEKYNSLNDQCWGLSVQNPATNGVGCGVHFAANPPIQPNTYSFIGAANTVFNQWDFYAITYSRSLQQFKAYKNGILLNTVATSTLALVSTNTVINIGYSPGGPDEFSNGDMDEVRLYNRALSDKEISALYALTNECALPVTGIDATEPAVTDIRIYPNPGTGKVWLDNLQDNYFEIYDVLGKKINYSEKEIDANTKEVLLNTGAQGFYFLKIFDANGSLIKTSRLVITK